MPGFNIPFDICVEDQEGGNVPQAARLGYLPPGHTMETARSHRFRLSITFAPVPGEINIPFNSIIDFFPQKIGRPSVEIDTITIHNGQDEIFRPGKQHHQPIEIEFYEMIGDETNQINFTARSLFNWWYRQTLQYETSLIQRPLFLNNTVNIVQLDGLGGEVWNYFLHHCWPDKVTPRDHDYTESAIQTTIVRLKYNKINEKQSTAP